MPSDEELDRIIYRCFEVPVRADSGFPVLRAMMREAIAASQKWRAPETAAYGEECLVLIDGHRGPAWSNTYQLVAYRSSDGYWREERHPYPPEPLVGVIGWMPLAAAQIGGAA